MWQLFNLYSGTELLIVIVTFVLAVLFAMTMHEYAHARAAVKQGDKTPIYQHRYTLNPLAHIDLVGFLCLILFGFGWAKPVGVNPLSFKEYRKGKIEVSVAGILTNLVSAFFSIGFLFLLEEHIAPLLPVTQFWASAYLAVAYFFQFFALISLNLAVLNLLPIYPLDGWNFISNFIKPDSKFARFMMKYSWLILLLLMLTDLISIIIGYLVSGVLNGFMIFWSYAIR